MNKEEILVNLEQIKTSLEELETQRDSIQILCIKSELELSLDYILRDYKKVLQKNEKYKQFFDLMLRLDSDYFMNCGDEETNELVDEILKLESE